MASEKGARPAGNPAAGSRRLGRGLEALLGSAPPRVGEERRPGEQPVQRIPLTEIRANPLQPRREFKEEELKELRESMRVNGLLQPVSVRPDPGARGYQLIAGERRWRAAQVLGWSHIPAIVRDVDDQTLLALALVENLQRADLDPLEEALGYRQLIAQFSLTQQAVAQLIGKSRSTVANFLRLLELPERVQGMLRSGELTVGQVRPLLTLGDHDAIVSLAAEIRERRLPARVVEQRTARAPGKRPRRKATARQADPNVRALEDQLRRHLQTDVRVVSRRGGGGNIAIRFYSSDDLQRLLERFGMRGVSDV